MIKLHELTSYLDAAQIKPQIEKQIAITEPKIAIIVNKLVDEAEPNPKSSACTIEVEKFNLAGGTKCIVIRWERTIYTRDEVSDITQKGTLVIPLWILCEKDPVAAFTQARKTGIWSQQEKHES